MALTKKQLVAIVAVIVVGFAAGGGVLLSGRSSSAPRTSEKAHDDHDQGGTEQHAAADADDHKSEKAGGRPAAESSSSSASGANGQKGLPDKKADGDAIQMTKESREAAAISTAVAGPAPVQTMLQFPGEIRFNEDRTAHVVPRVPGVVESVPANIGQTVRKGQLLAIVASTLLAEQRSELQASQQRLQLAKTTFDREKKLWEEKISAEQDYLQARTALQEAEISVRNSASKLSAIGATAVSGGLNRFEIRAPFDGTITAKHISLGEAVQDTATIFTISDLNTVWAEFAVSAKDIAQVRVGERASVSSTAFTGQASGTVSYLGSLLGEQTRTAQGRVTLKNPNLSWRPGLFVTVAVGGEQKPVPVAVRAEAIQTVEDQTVVFLETPTGFISRRVTIGGSDGTTTEIRDGLRPGERYAASNTFVLKAELGKGSAEHAH